jgi:hypothetical protein
MPTFLTARIVRKDHDYSGDDDQDTACVALAKGLDHLAHDNPDREAVKALAEGWGPWLYAENRPNLYSVYQVTIPLGPDQDDAKGGRPMVVEHLFTGNWDAACAVAYAEAPRVFTDPLAEGIPT